MSQPLTLNTTWHTHPPDPSLSALLFDHHRASIITIRDDHEIRIPPQENVPGGLQVELEHKGAIRDAKWDSGGRLWGVLRSAKMLEIVDVSSTGGNAVPVQEILRDANSSDAVLGFEWTFAGELVVVGGTGLHMYQYSNREQKLVLKKTVGVRVNWYSYWADHHVLVASIGPSALRLFYFRPDAVCDQLVQMTLQPANANQGVSAQVTRKQVVLMTIYGRLFCGFFDLTTPTPTLALYRITKSGPHKPITYQLDARGSFVASVVDSLVVVHNLVTKNYMIIDLKHDLTLPLLTAKHTSLPQTDDDSSLDDQEWHPIPPFSLLLPTRQILYTIHLNLESIITAMEDSATDVEIVKFLLRREGGEVTGLVLRRVLGMMRREVGVGVLRVVFGLIGAAGGERELPTHASVDSISSLANGMQTISRRSTSHGTLGSRNSLARVHAGVDEQLSPSRLPYCFQELMYANVFAVLAEEETPSTPYLTHTLILYLSSLPPTKPALPALHALLSTLLLRSKRYTELHQYVQYNVVEDSIDVARLLLEREGEYRPFAQLGLDMLKRLGEEEEVVEVLLGRGQVLDALRYAISRNLPHPTAPRFLEASLALNDKALFLNVFKSFEDRGLISSHSDDHLLLGGYPQAGNAQMGRFLSVYRELWGEIVEMENMVDM
ncbi:colon cancer-associated protein Mic1-like-domain-containing protein [Fimicolochytrium jonesii]|uniref:colon cancer-associated protein Mic1-like-domain-containing protein n=1 Tax=Fimicolochytrium jonesii TaxID=1396493 RepID=UPI0022FE9EA9|nr:colon cancer-associated protein Mic1-like-domain-containing protein [Fimicolochytrium jonesii]KAI8816160.1 colon cancer-associated protein Mic1-like-domain-containing protein [Fimicolochytrium jonesii]